MNITNTRSATRILTTALAECQRQETDFRGLVDLLSAYEVANYCNTVPLTEALILRLGQLIDPISNEFGYRRTPVTFANGGGSTSPQNIPNAMYTLVVSADWIEKDVIETRNDDIDVWIKTFLFIHPFKDGNGRCAWLLYNMLRDTMDYPLPLPKYDW